MSMNLSLKRLTDASRERILVDPKEISLCFDLPDRTPFSFRDFFRQLFGGKTRGGKKPQERDPHFDELECDLDKSWDVLCFLFCGATYSDAEKKSFPANFLCCCKEAINIYDLFGYGPPWTYSSQEAKEIAGFLESLTEEQLRARFVPSALKKVDPYPSVWDQYEADDSPEWKAEWDYFYGFFPNLKKFVRETANRDLALLLYLS